MFDVPAALGYRMPAEWGPHAATWIAWPHRRSDWPGKLPAVVWVYAEIVRHLSRSEPVRILVNDAKSAARAARILRANGVDLGRVEFVVIPTDRVWTRDYCPLWLVGPSGAVAVTDWHFNGWAKYPDWQLDDAVPGELAERFGWRSWQPSVNGQRVVLEGGSIDVNGEGLLLTTEECLLSPVQARNPDLTRADLERALRDYLGVTTVVWLGQGIAGDDTHGHVDDLARFVGPRTVVTVVEDDEADVNHVPLRENWERLRGIPGLEVVELPMPEPVVFRGQRLPASYANFYVANDRVLVPTFNDPSDRVALGVLGELFRGRTVVGVHAVDLVWGLGTLHCLTQQQPAG
jgi:agmatine deiminase